MENFTRRNTNALITGLFFSVALSLPVMILPFMSSPALAADSADDIVHKSDEARGPKIAYSFSASVENYNGADGTKNVYHVAVKGTELSLVEQTEPTRLVGRKLLMRGHDLWLYTPEIKRPTRIGFEQRLTGEVANGDLARTRFSEDYSSEITGSEKVEGKDCYKLHLTAKTKEVTYRQIDYWVEKNTFYPRQALFYAISGKLLKTATYSEFKPVLGHSRMTRTEIKDAIQPSKRSVLVFSAQKEEHFDDSFFNKESLGE